jgi:hypothetical protein
MLSTIVGLLGDYFMKLKRTIIYFGLLLFVISITGCVYLRLLEVKKQLSNFESYFRIDDQHELTLISLEPVLLTEDIIWLTKLDPTSKEKTDQGELWRYIFEKQYSGPKNEEGDFNIPVIMLFQNDKLREVRFPERFLKFVSKPLLIRMFQSMGYSEINKLRRSASSNFQGRNLLEIPRKEFVLKVLGKPFNVEESDHTSKFTYKYNLKSTEPGSRSKESELWARFTFDRRDEAVLKAEGKFSRFNISMDFSVEGSGGVKNGRSK